MRSLVDILPSNLCLVAIPFLAAVLASPAMAAEKQAGSRGGGELEPGQAAPSFSLPGSDGKTHRLADNLGRRPVVIAWFPKAFTGG
jgi:hypothetical protein